MKKSLKRTIQIALLIIILGIIIIPRIGFFTRDEQSQLTSNRESDLSVSAVLLTPGVMENTIRAAGSLIASEEVDVSTEISGLIYSVHFEEGTKVKRGDLLVRIDDSELQAQRDKAIHQRKLIQQTFERQKVLLEKEAISREVFDKVQTDLLVIEAEIKLLDTRIEKTNIRAPFDGTIGFRYASPGAWLQPGNRIARLVRISPLRLEFSIPERYQAYGLTGRTAYFNVSGFDEVFEAKVYAIDPSVDTGTRSINLRAWFSNEDQKLLPGMFTDIRIVISRDENVMLVPTEAIIPQMDGDLIFVYRNGNAIQLPIVTGNRTENMISVSEGLAIGDTIITSGILQLRTGMPVTLKNLE